MQSQFYPVWGVDTELFFPFFMVPETIFQTRAKKIWPFSLFVFAPSSLRNLAQRQTWGPIWREKQYYFLKKKLFYADRGEKVWLSHMLYLQAFFFLSTHCTDSTDNNGWPQKERESWLCLPFWAKELRGHSLLFVLVSREILSLVYEKLNWLCLFSTAS